MISNILQKHTFIYAKLKKLKKILHDLVPDILILQATSITFSIVLFSLLLQC